MTGSGLPLAADARDAALHGSWCPKMCSHACPVLRATGRADAVPWSLHRTVLDLADGALAPAHAARPLEPCTGCLACQVPCLFDQDVPAQVRAARAALVDAGQHAPAVAQAVEAVAAGRSPYGAGPHAEAEPASPARPGDTAGADLAVVVGCRDEPATLQAFLRLARAAGASAAAVTPPGCCGGVLDDLGAGQAADDARVAIAAGLGASQVVALDPHCLTSLREAANGDRRVVDAVTWLAEALDAGRLRLSGPRVVATYHDPCLLARTEGVTAPPRRLLRAAGADLREPEGHGETTVCSGAGLGFDLLAPGDADAVASVRRTQLRAPGAQLVVTACSGARRRLSGSGLAVADLFEFLADRCAEAPRGRPRPHDGAAT